MNLRKKLCVDDLEKAFSVLFPHTPMTRTKPITIKISVPVSVFLTHKGAVHL